MAEAALDSENGHGERRRTPRPALKLQGLTN